MATTSCPACGLTVPYFCCEGLVCPACGYDEEHPLSPQSDVAESKIPQASPGQTLSPDSGVRQSPPQ